MRLTRRQALSIAVVCGVLAAVLSYVYLKRPTAPKPPPEVAQVQVLIANADIPTGARLNPSLLGVKAMTETEAPKGAILADEGWEGKVEGMVAVASLQTNDILTDTSVRRPTSQLGLAFMVPDGMRAVTVSLDEVSGVGWLVKPGDRVDVLATFELPDDTILTKTVLQDIDLLAIGTQIVPEPEPEPAAEEGAPKPKPAPRQQTTATLCVSPDDAQRLVLADTKGKLRLALRRAGDTRLVAAKPTSLTDMTGYVPLKPQEAPGGPGAPGQALPPWYQPPPQPGGQGPRPEGKPRNAVEVVRGSEREVIVP